MCLETSEGADQEIFDEEQKHAAYEYLCRLEEAKIWMEAVLNESLPPSLELEENLRNGVYLAKIGHFIAPEVVPLSRIYDIFQNRYKNNGLQFRHTDNINYWLESLKSIGFPKMFLVETTDVYEKKNMPKVVYCLHALSAHLFQMGQAPAMENLYGKVHFNTKEIMYICWEIKKFEFTIPAFQKIGGLISKMMECSSNKVSSSHIKVVDVNNAVDEGSEEKLFESLNCASLGLSQVIPKYTAAYLDVFRSVKEEKVQTAQNRSLNRSYEPDIYDNLLHLSEIQGLIRKVNIDCVWKDIITFAKERKEESLKNIIATSFTDFKDFNAQNIKHYMSEILLLNCDQMKTKNSRDAIQNFIRNGNRNAKERARVLDAVTKVKRAILNKSKEELLSALRAPSLKLSSQISDFAGSLYLEELEADFKMSKDLTYNDIKSSITILNEIAKLSSAVDSRDAEATLNLILNSDVPFMNVDPALKTDYFKSLLCCRQEKLLQDLENNLLTFIDIQECIDMANIKDLNRIKALVHMEEINEAVKKTECSLLKTALEGLIPGEVSSDDVVLYMTLLKKYLAQKQGNTEKELWLDDVLNVGEQVANFKEAASEIFQQLYKDLSKRKPVDSVLKSIENYGDYKLPKPNQSIVAEKTNVWSSDCWLTYDVADDVLVYFNLNKKTMKWSKPEEIKENLKFLSAADLHTPISPKSKVLVNSNTHSGDVIAVIHCITHLQAAIRGFLVRKNIRKILAAVVIIQKWWRRIKQKQLGAQQSQFAQNLMPCDLNYFQNHVNKIIKIQAFWRGYRSRKNLALQTEKSLSICPPFQLLRHLASMQQINVHNYSIDLKVQKMKSCVVEIIKRNQELAVKLEEMDMKIGLLVQNRMSVETILAEKKNLQSVRLNGFESNRGIKALSKEAKKLLDGYQQLFYVLQTNPVYLTRLIVRLPSRLNHVIQGCVFSLFNHGSNSRDAYFLLRLFRSALFEEVQCNFQKPVDAVTGNPLVLRLAIAYARQAEGYNPLRNILGFLIEKVLNDKVFIDTNPVDIYRRWINQMETESGNRSNLPPTVSVEEALTYPEVVSRLNHNIRILKSWVKCFLERLSSCINQFPYALRYVAKLLRNALLQKFPQTPEKDILKIVGNLVYYQYINSAIVAPDAFYIISQPTMQLRVEQRKNLASIAKILHFAATKKGFGEESKYLNCLNSFIVECHEEMKRFCKNCCAVKDLEDHFQITEYSEAALIDKPRIYITLEEIRECHKLLLEAQYKIAPDSSDSLHEILEDLGPTPSLAILIGCDEDSSERNLFRAGKIQVCLELDNKFQSPPDDSTEYEKLFIKTKELITNRLFNLKGNTLAEAIQDPSQTDLATNLATLELAGLVKSSDDYKNILTSLIQDICHRQDFINRQNKEIRVLRVAQQRLNEKQKFYEDQLVSYEQYLKTCLNNLMTPSQRPKKKERSVKYSGTRLREKGVLISLDGVPSGQLKNVQFEISVTNLDGIYSVQGRFMGVEVEKVDIDIQELLRLQFEGHREISLFKKAQINVNLLLHLLNKKFNSCP